MTCHAFVFELRAGYEAEYDRRHAEIWPEMLDALRAAGIRNYRIFRRGVELFGVFETDDFARTCRMLAESEVNRRWSDYMAPIIKTDIDPATGFHTTLPLCFEMP